MSPYSFLRYLSRNPLHLFVWLLYLTTFTRVLSTSSSTTQNEEENLHQLYFPYHRVTFPLLEGDFAPEPPIIDKHEQAVTEYLTAENRNEWDRIINERYPHGSVNLPKKPTVDISRFEEEIRLKVYRMLSVEKSFKGLNQIQDSINQLLTMNPQSELGITINHLSQQFSAHDGEPEMPTDYIFLNNIELSQPLSYFARAFDKVRMSEARDNLALLLSALHDLESAQQLETNNAVKNTLYYALKETSQPQIKKMSNRVEDYNHFNLLATQYSFKIDLKAPSQLRPELSPPFTIEELKEAIAQNLPLILRSDANTQLAFISQNNDFYVYKVTFISDYKMTLDKLFHPDGAELIRPNNLVSMDFLQHNVIGVVSNQGFIATNSASLQAIFKQNTSAFWSVFRYGMLGLGLLASFVGAAYVVKAIKNYINTARRARTALQIFEEVMQIKINLILKELNESHLTDLYIPNWSLTKTTNYCYHLQGSIKISKTLLDIRAFVTKLFPTQPTLSNITIDPKIAQNIIFEQYKNVFKNLILKNDIAACEINFDNLPKGKYDIKGKLSHSTKKVTLTKIAPSRNHKSNIEEKINRANKKILIALINASPELQCSILRNMLKVEKSELKANQANLSKYDNSLSQIKSSKDAAQYHFSSSETVKRKASDVLNLCENLLNQLEIKTKDQPSKQQSNNKSLPIQINALGKTIESIETRLTKLESSLTPNSSLEIQYSNFHDCIKNLKALMGEANQLTLGNQSVKEQLVNISSLLTELENKNQEFKQARIKEGQQLPSKKADQKTTNNNNANENVTSPKASDPAIQDKNQRLSKIAAEKKAALEEKLKKQQEEQERLRRKQEADEKVKKTMDKLAEIDKLKHDPKLAMLDHQIILLIEALALYNKPEQNDLLKYCGDEKSTLYKRLMNVNKEISYYIFLMGLIKGSHSIGLLMIRFKEYFILQAKPYEIRNQLMHKFWLVETDMLALGAKEFTETFKKMHNDLCTKGFPDQKQAIKMESVLYNDDFLNKLKGTKINKKTLQLQISRHFANLTLMSNVIEHICLKNPDIYYRYCGLLHHAATSCINIIGVLLNKLKKIEPELYQMILKELGSFEILIIKNNNSNVSIYQNARDKVGHFFSSKDTHEHKSNYIELTDDIYKELTPEAIRYICRDSEQVWLKIKDSIAQVPKSNLNPDANEFRPNEGFSTDFRY